MFTFWNARPLLVTTNLVEQAQLRILLRRAGIPHRVRISRFANDGTPAAARGQVVDYSHEYTIYIRNKDAARARALCSDKLSD